MCNEQHNYGVMNETLSQTFREANIYCLREPYHTCFMKFMVLNHEIQRPSLWPLNYCSAWDCWASG